MWKSGFNTQNVKIYDRHGWRSVSVPGEPGKTPEYEKQKYKVVSYCSTGCKGSDEVFSC